MSKKRPVFSGVAVFNSATGKQISATFKYKTKRFYETAEEIKQVAAFGMARLEIRPVQPEQNYNRPCPVRRVCFPLSRLGMSHASFLLWGVR